MIRCNITMNIIIFHLKMKILTLLCKYNSELINEHSRRIWLLEREEGNNG